MISADSITCPRRLRARERDQEPGMSLYGGGFVKDEQSAATSALSKLVAEETEVICSLVRLWSCVVRKNPDEKNAIRTKPRPLGIT